MFVKNVLKQIAVDEIIVCEEYFEILSLNKLLMTKMTLINKLLRMKLFFNNVWRIFSNSIDNRITHGEIDVCEEIFWKYKCTNFSW